MQRLGVMGDWAAIISAICAAGVLLAAIGSNLVRVGSLANKVSTSEANNAKMQSEIDATKAELAALTKTVAAEYVHHSTMERLETNVNTSIDRLFARMDNGFNTLGNRIDNLLQAKPNA